MPGIVPRTPCVSLVMLAMLAAPPGARCADAAADHAAQPRDTPDGESSRARAHVTEEVVVTARGTAADLPSALATELVTFSDAIAPPSDVQDLLIRIPGVGATGQNGIFETFSIRGSGGNGILVLVGGMPVTAQRRAGVPISFVEPSLLGEINVTRGPATVHFGPGALGGAVSIEPRWFDSSAASAGYATAGDETTLTGGFGNASFSLGAARQHAGLGRAPDGTPLNTGFERVSASLQYRTRFDTLDIDALLLPSRTEDIGKSNSRYPVRDTDYPEDEHTLARLRLRHASGVEASLHGHDQRLTTHNRRPGAPDTFASIEGTDLGATLQHTLRGERITGNVGVEFLGRRGVDGFDASGSFGNRSYSLRDAREDVWSAFALADWRPSARFATEFGARVSRLSQTQEGAQADDSDRAFTAAAIWTPDERRRWSANLSSGYRFATLEERFYSGVTPQGEIVGNPDLGSEKSLGLDLGHAWRGIGWGAQIHVWRTDVDDLIQLFEIEPGVNGYTNVGKARLHGAEAAFDWNPLPQLSLRASAALVRSRDELSGDPLYGTPPLSATLEARYDFDDVTFGAFYTHRWRMDRPGFEEVERDAVDLLDLDLSWRLRDAWRAQFFVRNALDQNYFATADELSALAQERSIGVKLTWSANLH